MGPAGEFNGRFSITQIVSAKSNEAAAALALTVSAGGGATVNTTVLITPDEIDAATSKDVKYKPPGS